MKIYNPYKSQCFFFLFLLLFLIPVATCLAHSWMAPASEANLKNPIPNTIESVNIGSEIFKELCSSCHGLKGEGLKKQDTGISVDTPNLPARLSTHSDGDFHWKILNGKDDMPSFKDELSQKEVWNIINYIKTLTKQ